MSERKEYKISKKNHKKVFPNKTFSYGMKKYKYYTDERFLIIESWNTNLALLCSVLFFIPMIFIVGIPDAIRNIGHVFVNVYKKPIEVDRIQNLYSIYKDFMEYAVRKG